MSDEKKNEDIKKENEIKKEISTNIEAFSEGFKKILEANAIVKIKNFNLKAEKIYLKFPGKHDENVVAEKAKEEAKTSSGSVNKEYEIELKEVSIKKCNLTFNIPQVNQEIILKEKK